MTTSTPNIDPSIFTTLQTKIDEESAIRDSLRAIIDDLSKQSRVITSHLSRIHNTPTPLLPDQILSPCAALLQQQSLTVQALASTASAYPFYKYNSLWSHQIQSILSTLQLHEWLSSTRLLTLEDLGTFLNVPVNVKPPEKDTFHITIEEYLLALTSTIEELARLAPNAVTMGDYARPLQISRFIKDVHAGFQLLNLKNDNLRRRSDGVKYSVKKVEDVVYDLSLRGLVPKDGDEGGAAAGGAASG
ncbi:Translin-1 [Cyphellophora attinorum]|uniref:Translin-1 n=1 Tax=Cyphellophora attinorum TaxID=1664694 RepID=A0A0N0NPU5_9EURO|nr:Translin-1 [Phialophora attinorum]KPI43161.1 Translin-1 [Phialophora attinorum]